MDEKRRKTTQSRRAQAGPPSRGRRRLSFPREEIAPCVPVPTAVAAEAMRTGVMPSRHRHHDDARADERLLVGDPDDNVFDNEYVGDEVPGGSMPTPDQNDVDEIGKAYGVQEEDSGALRTSSELLEERDRHRAELVGPAKGRK